MKFHNRKTRTLLVLCLVFAIAVCALGVAAIKRQQVATHLPNVISKVKSLEVVGVTVKGEGDARTAIIEIRNKSDKPVIAITIESGDADNAAGVTLNGFNDGDESPTVVLEPHSTTTVDFALSNVMYGSPIKIGAVMYVDNSEEGDEISLQTMRGQKEHYKAKDSKKKGVSPQ